MRTPPTIWAHVRHSLGRALRETGQAIDRVGIRGEGFALRYPGRGDDPPFIFQDHLSRHRQLFPMLWRGAPKVHQEVAFVAPCATLIGSVCVEKGASIWYGAILRADSCFNGIRINDNTNNTNDDVEAVKTEWLEAPPISKDDAEYDKHERPNAQGGGIIVGEDTNIQDGCIISSRTDHTVFGKGVTVGHMAQVHSSRIGDHSLIGMGSIVQEGCNVAPFSFIAAGAVLGRGTVIPSGELWVGNPAKKLRDLTAEEKDKLIYQADEYVKVASGQSEVMDLGGNVPDTLIEHLLLKPSEEQEKPDYEKGVSGQEEKEGQMLEHEATKQQFERTR